MLFVGVAFVCQYVCNYLPTVYIGCIYKHSYVLCMVLSVYYRRIADLKRLE